MKNKSCLICSKCFIKPYTRSKKMWYKTKYCSTRCKQISMIGKKHTKEHKLKISKALKNKDWSWKIGIPHGHKTSNGGGWKLTIEQRKKLSDYKTGRPMINLRRASNGMWKGGITPIHRAIRTSFEYEQWRRKIFERDNYTCQICKQIGGILHADHIKPFSLYPDLRFSLNNGRTLCISCHRKTDTYGSLKSYIQKFEVIK